MSADSVARRQRTVPGVAVDRSRIEGDMKRKKGEDGEEFDVFDESADEYGDEEVGDEESDLYDDDLEEEFDDEDADFDEDFDEDADFEEEGEDFDDLVNDDE